MKSLNKVLLVTFFLIFSLSLSVQGELVRINIPAKVEINTNSLYLGDLAEIEVLTELDKEKLKEIKIGEVPLGYERIFSQVLIAERIKQYLHSQGYTRDSFSLDMENRVKVKRKTQTIAADKLLSLVEAYLIEELPYNKHEMKIEPLFKVRDIEIPVADYQINIFILNNNNLNLANISVAVKISTETWQRNIYFAFRVTVRKEVYVAVRNLKRQETISKDDFSLEKRELNFFRGELITDLNHFLVKEGLVKNYIRQGQILTSDLLELPIIVNWGDQLRAELKVGGISMSTMVKARQSGRKGEMILVENPDSAVRLKARIIDERQVIVEGIY